MGSKVKVNDGSNCWKMKRCWRRKSTIESLLEIVFGCKYIVCRKEKKTFVMWRLAWMTKKEMNISFKIHQTQKWYSSILLCELDWIKLKKKFIPFQMKCIYHIMVKMCYYFIHNKNEVQWKMVERRWICLPLKLRKKERT